jgi:hypothetical protein
VPKTIVAGWAKAAARRLMSRHLHSALATTDSSDDVNLYLWLGRKSLRLESEQANGVGFDYFVSHFVMQIEQGKVFHPPVWGDQGEV